MFKLFSKVIVSLGVFISSIFSGHQTATILVPLATPTATVSPTAKVQKNTEIKTSNNPTARPISNVTILPSPKLETATPTPQIVYTATPTSDETKNSIENLTREINDLKQKISTLPTPTPTPVDTTPPAVNIRDGLRSSVGSYLARDWCNNGGLFCKTIYLSVGVYDPNSMNDLVRRPVTSYLYKVQCFVDETSFYSITNDDLTTDISIGRVLDNSIPFDTTIVPNGKHTIKCVASDHAGNIGQDSFGIEIKN